MKKFFFVTTPQGAPLYGTFARETILRLKSQPYHWPLGENTLPEGDWTMSHISLQPGSGEELRRHGLMKLFPQELPAICFTDGGEKNERCLRVTLDQALQFIADRI